MCSGLRGNRQIHNIVRDLTHFYIKGGAANKIVISIFFYLSHLEEIPLSQFV